MSVVVTWLMLARYTFRSLRAISYLGGFMQVEEYTIPQMVDDVRAGKMPRRQFIKTLSVMGISAAGIGAISTAAARSFTSTPGYQEKLDKAVGTEKLTQLHDQHLEHQSQGNVDALQH